MATDPTPTTDNELNEPEPIFIESWHDLEQSVIKAYLACNAIPAPPIPDDGWSDRIRQLKEAIEGVQQLLVNRSQAEDENEL